MSDWNIKVSEEEAQRITLAYLKKMDNDKSDMDTAAIIRYSIRNVISDIQSNINKNTLSEEYIGSDDPIVYIFIDLNVPVFFDEISLQLKQKLISNYHKDVVIKTFYFNSTVYNNPRVFCHNDKTDYSKVVNYVKTTNTETLKEVYVITDGKGQHIPFQLKNPEKWNWIITDSNCINSFKNNFVTRKNVYSLIDLMNIDKIFGDEDKPEVNKSTPSEEEQLKQLNNLGYTAQKPSFRYLNNLTVGQLTSMIIYKPEVLDIPKFREAIKPRIGGIMGHLQSDINKKKNFGRIIAKIKWYFNI